MKGLYRNLIDLKCYSILLGFGHSKNEIYTFWLDFIHFRISAYPQDLFSIFC